MSKVLVVDPGHGGSDSGAVGNGLLEKNLNLYICKAVVRKLAPYDVSVYLTRDKDVDVSLSDRARLAREKQADYFLSIHVNAGRGTGFESFIYIYPLSGSAASRDVIHRQVAAYLNSEGFPDRGKKSANFYVLRNSPSPAILLENLFIDTKKDAAWLSSESNLSRLAGKIALGLVKALQLTKKPAVWNPEKEIADLAEDGIINSLHATGHRVKWGELATVFNRIRGKKVEGETNWNPGAEIGLLIKDGILKEPRTPETPVSWWEFATVLNRMRHKDIPGQTTWNPAGEIDLLIKDGYLKEKREPQDPLFWGEFATVLNRYRETL